MSRIILVLALLLTLGACSIFEPFVDRRREAGAESMEKLYVGQSKPETPAVCYNILTADYAEVKKLADEECVKQGTGNEAKPIKQTVFTCRLLVPNHLYFTCINNENKKEVKQQEEMLKQVQHDN